MYYDEKTAWQTSRPLTASGFSVRPWEEIAMDFIMDLPKSRVNTVIWTVIYLFSKQAHFVACTGLSSARKLAKLFLTNIYRLYGVPQQIISDRGVQFTVKFWQQFLAMIGLSQGLSSAFHPSTNGAVERTNAMIQQYVRCYVEHQQGDWADLLPFAEVAYNNTVHSSTGYTPFYVTSGVEFVPIPECPRPKPKELGLQEWVTQMTGVWGHIKDALRKAAEKYKSQADRKRRP